MNGFKKILLLSLLILLSSFVNAQKVKGRITVKGKAVPFANVVVEGDNLGVAANDSGVNFSPLHE